MNQLKETFILLASIFLLIFSIVFMSHHVNEILSTDLFYENKIYTVAIDAGHGGFDSGKVGVDGTLEKDLNLQIAQKLELLLTAADVQVIMIRTTDTALSKDGSSNLKRQDMINRCASMNESKADCVISIHQNSYPDSSVDGAQVFYYTNSTSGKKLASLIQQKLIHTVDPSNHRKEKSNDNYFLLKNVSAPIVIVECGFLSNPEESKKLVDDTYQHKLAWAIHLGVMQYLNDISTNLHISE